MPQYDYSGLASGLGRSADMISQHVMRMPQIRHQLQQEAMTAAERAQVMQAQAASYNANAREGNAKAANIEAQGSASQQLGDFLRKYARGGTNEDGSLTFTIDPEGVNEIAASAAMAGKSASDSMGAVGKLATTIRAPGEAQATRRAAGERNQAAVDARSNTALEIARMGSTAAASPGSAIYDKRTGKIIGQVPSAAGARELYDTETQVYPAVEAVPAVPGNPASTNWMGRVTPGTPGTPGIPAQPERRVTRRLQRSAVGGQSAEAAPAPATVDSLARAGVAHPAFTEEADNYQGQESVQPQAMSESSRGATQTSGPKQPTYAEALIAEANQAIAMGADPAKVKARLIEKGIQLQ